MALIPAASTEYLHIPITGPAGVDLTNSPVRIAIVLHNSNPTSGEWRDATWADGAARILIGPDGGTLTLTAGTYTVWVAVDPPGAEHIVRKAKGLLLVT